MNKPQYIFLFTALLIGSASFAQDTLRKRTVQVTSSFKPVLKDAAKINFTASPPNADTSKPNLQYTIPNQNLLFAYQPGLLKPLALSIDSGGRWDNYSYFKAGYGTLNSPYFQAGISLGDGKTAGFNIYAEHFSAKGKIENQKSSNTGVELNGFIQTGNTEIDARFGGREDQYRKYGYQPSTLKFVDDSLNVKFQTWSARFAAHNINQTALGISYAPEVKIDVFRDQLTNRESNVYFNLPVRKYVGTSFSAEVAVDGNFTNYDPVVGTNINNNYFQLSPSVIYASSLVSIQAGIRPGWDNDAAKIFPNILAEFSLDKRLVLQAGWTGTFRSNNYLSLANFNPWIWAPNFSNNSGITERFGGVKGTLTDHFTYSARLGYNTITNQPLYINDTASGKSFIALNEPKMDVLRLNGELGFNVGEKFSLTSSIIVSRYMNQERYEKAFGLLPFEFKTALRIQVLKDLYVKGDVYAFDKPWIRLKDGKVGQGDGAMDLSAGLEFAIIKNLKIWGQFNNILNNEYMRSNQYPSYGFNFMGGLILSLSQNHK
jgi:hypothetical protein